MICEKMSQNTKLSEIISLTKETMEGSSIHALPNIVRNKYYTIKAVWFVCFIISTAGCCYLIIQSVNDYLSFDVVTKIQVNEKDKITFPMIKVCPITPFTSNYSLQLAQMLFKTTNIDDSILSLNQFSNNTDPYLVQSNFYISRSLLNYVFQTNAVKMNSTYRKKLGPTFDEILISCWSDLSVCNKSNDLDYFYDTIYGNCFKFNSGKNMNGEGII
jgi:hypothetical protein